MPNKSYRKSTEPTSSGHGALGMGGQPDDDPRDLNSGHEGMADDDRTRSVDGASGSNRRTGDAAGSVAGVKGDRAVDEAIGRRAGS